ncbi:sugar porter family MFS transporter [Candidatus Pantoea deserta]|uniref:Sugar porter family MFS transporter n=1 Tax=Candidatus Pantoea deserta TaxID=1869313 RepID=A0A3N4PCR4_9GAMM|nr:sugar porter family MFS transporter [Pantoea deserta]RPE01510.1 sugar porter family MFS transporter [Pantoea deserta]
MVNAEIREGQHSTGKSKNISIFIIMSIIISSVGGIIFGYDTGIIGGAIVFIGKQFHITDFMQGIIVSMSLLGAMIGALLAGPLADKYGRKINLFISGICFAAGAVLSGYSNSIELLTFARILQGIGVGASSVLVPVYIAELAPAKVRGLLVTSFQLMITVGIVIAYGVNTAAESQGSWRFPVGIASVFGIALALGVLFVTESPRWLIATNKHAAARRTLIKLRGTDDVDEEIKETERLNALEQDDIKWRDLLSGHIRPMIVIGVLVAFFSNACGINLVIYFAPQILQTSGFTSSASWAGTVGLGLTNVIFTVVGMLIVDKVGRRPLLIAGAAGLTISLVILALIFSVPAFEGSSWLALASLVFYVVMYAVSPGMLGFLIISEISPLRARAKATSLSIFIIFATNLVIALVSLPMLNGMGASATFWLFAAICVAFTIFSFYVPETKGKSLEDVEIYFKEKYQ